MPGCQGRLRPGFISHHGADRARSAHSAVLASHRASPAPRCLLSSNRKIRNARSPRFFPPYADNFVLLSSASLPTACPLIPRHSDLPIIIIPLQALSPASTSEMKRSCSRSRLLSLLHFQHVLCTIMYCSARPLPCVSSSGNELPQLVRLPTARSSFQCSISPRPVARVARS